MSITPLTSEPASITAGDTISWDIALPDYPASAGWTLKYKAVCATGYFAMVSTASGDNHLIAVAKAITAVYPAGTYSLTKYVESTTELVTLSETTLIVRPCISGMTAAFDNRTHNRKVLAALEAVLEGTATTDQQETTIDGTTIKRRTVADLLKMRSTYALRVWREENPGKLCPTVQVSFRG